MLTTPALMFDLTSPIGTTFMAAVIDGDDGFVHVLSTQHGQWQRELRITAADLLLPSQGLSEWDVREIKPHGVVLA